MQSYITWITGCVLLADRSASAAEIYKSSGFIQGGAWTCEPAAEVGISTKVCAVPKVRLALTQCSVNSFKLHTTSVFGPDGAAVRNKKEPFSIFFIFNFYFIWLYEMKCHIFHKYQEQKLPCDKMGLSRHMLFACVKGVFFTSELIDNECLCVCVL